MVDALGSQQKAHVTNTSMLAAWTVGGGEQIDARKACKKLVVTHIDCLKHCGNQTCCIGLPQIISCCCCSCCRLPLPLAAVGCSQYEVIIKICQTNGHMSELTIVIGLLLH